MEGVEPLGGDLDLLRVFYELGVRAIGLTHARRNAAGSGGIFAASGSPRDGLTAFGRDLVRECEGLGIIVDLAHINPKGFEEIVDLTTKPLIVFAHQRAKILRHRAQHQRRANQNGRPTRRCRRRKRNPGRRE